MAPGRLLITIHDAQLRRDTAEFNSMDPYVKLIIGNQIQRTSTAQSAGKCPVWHQNFDFLITTEDILKLEVWDRDSLSKDDKIGDGIVTLNNLQLGASNFSVPLVFDGKQCGFVNCDFRFEPTGAQGFGQSGLGMGQSLPTQGFNQGMAPPNMGFQSQQGPPPNVGNRGFQQQPQPMGLSQPFMQGAPQQQQ
jgi:hypothetical protein